MSFEKLEETLGPDTSAAAEVVPVARGLGSLALPTENDPDELLKHRFLCRGGGLLLVGPTGAGKSALAMQAMILWALGREAFGIMPKAPLRSLLVQAENDDGDLAEMREGVIRGLGLSAEDAKRAVENVLVYRETSRTGMLFVSGVLRPLVTEHCPDLLWLDPALSYLGGEANSQADVGGFLRNLLNPLLLEANCGCVILHHTNKPPTGKEKREWQAGDFAYLGSGSSEWANWSRAVLAMRGTGSHDIFELIAAKRGKKLRWREPDGDKPKYMRLLGHSREPGVICWREAEPDEVAEVGGKNKKRVWTKEDVMPHVPPDKPIDKAALRSRCNAAGMPVNSVNGRIAELVMEGRLFEWRIRRRGTHPQLLIARIAQQEKDLVE